MLLGDSADSCAHTGSHAGHQLRSHRQLPCDSGSGERWLAAQWTKALIPLSQNSPRAPLPWQTERSTVNSTKTPVDEMEALAVEVLNGKRGWRIRGRNVNEAEGEEEGGRGAEVFII